MRRTIRQLIRTGDTDAANVAVAAGVADDTDVEPDVTKGEQA